jgi:hypothetical protein
MRAPSAGAISPRAVTARTVDIACRMSANVRNDDTSMPRRAAGVNGSAPRRQELRGGRPQQMGLAVEQIRQPPRAQQPRDKAEHPPLGIGNAARPPLRVSPSFPSRSARWHEAKMDQDQVLGIPRTLIRKTGDSRMAKANRQRLPALVGLRGNEAE